VKNYIVALFMALQILTLVYAIKIENRLKFISEWSELEEVLTQ